MRPLAYKAQYKAQCDTFRFVQLHKTCTIGPSETNGKPFKTQGKNSEIEELKIFTFFPILLIC